MAKKKPRPDPNRTERALSPREKELRQLLWIQVGVGVLTIAIAIILAIGVIVQSRQAVAIVNGQRIRVRDYQKRLRFWASNYNSSAGQGAFDRLEEEQKTGFYEQVVDQLIQEAIIEQVAAKNGVSVSDDEIEIEIEEQWFGHFRNPPTPTPSPTPDPEATPTTGPAQPTATPDTPEEYQEQYDYFVKNVLKPARVSQADFRSIVRATLLRTKMMTTLVPTVPTEEDQVHFRYSLAADEEQAARQRADLEAGIKTEVQARHILVDAEETAQSILSRLQDGEDFAALAAEFSIDESNKNEGGDLGWFGRGQMVPEFEQACFEGEIGVYPTPVQTQFGFHVIEILAREDRPLTAEEAMSDAGWYGKTELADSFGPLFTEIVFGSEIGMLAETVPTEFGVVIVEVLEHAVRPLSEMDQEARRSALFEERLAELVEEAVVEDMWEADMVPTTLP
jgi:parvulin-like peptidyl-prolyl isomerase